MKKRNELTDPNSCMSRARDDEMVFVLLGRDIAAPATIRFWAAERVRFGKNTKDDPQIAGALNCATVMERGRPFLQAEQQPETLYGVTVQIRRLLNDNARGPRGWTQQVLRTRCAGAKGVVIGHSAEHGLCFQVRHEDETESWYDLDELSAWNIAAP